MSIELVLFAFLFIVLPILMHLMGAVRKQRADHTVEATQRQSPAPRAQYLEPQPFLLEEDRALIEAAAKRTRKVPHERKDTARTHERNARGRPIGRLVGPLELRRAILLITVVGPCRASSPHGSPEPARPL